MRSFKSLEEVDAAGLPPPVHRACRGTLEALIGAHAEFRQPYSWEDDGFVVLVEEGDTDDALWEACGVRLREALFEGCTEEDGVFLTCVLFNNQFGISLVIPNEPWLPADVRDRLAADAL